MLYRIRHAGCARAEHGSIRWPSFRLDAVFPPDCEVVWLKEVALARITIGHDFQRMR
jgi:hypothetical protein